MIEEMVQQEMVQQEQEFGLEFGIETAIQKQEPKRTSRKNSDPESGIWRGISDDQVAIGERLRKAARKKIEFIPEPIYVVLSSHDDSCVQEVVTGELIGAGYTGCERTNITFIVRFPKDKDHRAPRIWEISGNRCFLSLESATQEAETLTVFLKKMFGNIEINYSANPEHHAINERHERIVIR